MPPMARTTVVIPDDMMQQLKHAAVEERTNVSRLIVTLVQEYLKSRRSRKALKDLAVGKR